MSRLKEIYERLKAHQVEKEEPLELGIHLPDYMILEDITGGASE